MSVKAAVKPKNNLEDILAFCPRCFASSEDGSWGGGPDVMNGQSLCSNCGANGSHVMIPRWAVNAIREQASWVGKRYYPHDEDYEHAAEIKALRDLVTVYPGRSAEKIKSDHPDDIDQWWVHQDIPGDKRIAVSVKARSAGEAMKKARLDLPYISKEALEKKVPGKALKVGQIWADSDKRAKGRTVKILAIEGERALCEVMTGIDGSEAPVVGRKVRVAVKRFRPTATGYELKTDV